jgi:hypothetical protein
LRRHRFNGLQARLLQRGVVVTVEVVDADHAVAALQQALHEGRTDESGRTGDEDWTGLIAAHASPSPTRQRLNPAFSTSVGETTERASNTQAGWRMSFDSALQFKCR